MYRGIGERSVEAGIVLWIHIGVTMPQTVEVKTEEVLEGPHSEEDRGKCSPEIGRNSGS